MKIIIGYTVIRLYSYSVIQLFGYSAIINYYQLLSININIFI